MRLLQLLERSQEKGKPENFLHQCDVRFEPSLSVNATSSLGFYSNKFALDICTERLYCCFITAYSEYQKYQRSKALVNHGILVYFFVIQPVIY